MEGLPQRVRPHQRAEVRDPPRAAAELALHPDCSVADHVAAPRSSNPPDRLAVAGDPGSAVRLSSERIGYLGGRIAGLLGCGACRPREALAHAALGRADAARQAQRHVEATHAWSGHRPSPPPDPARPSA